MPRGFFQLKNGIFPMTDNEMRFTNGELAALLRAVTYAIDVCGDVYEMKRLTTAQAKLKADLDSRI